jgi:hypothetical protein
VESRLVRVIAKIKVLDPGGFFVERIEAPTNYRVRQKKLVHAPNEFFPLVPHEEFFFSF